MSYTTPGAVYSSSVAYPQQHSAVPVTAAPIVTQTATPVYHQASSALPGYGNRPFLGSPSPQLTASSFYQHPPPQTTVSMPPPTQSTTYHITNQAPPANPTPFVASGSVGRIIPTEQPYAFTTVTYAKQPLKPNHDEFKKAYVRQTMHQQDYEQLPRVVKKGKGTCGGCNDCFCGCCDSNGGACGCLNCGGCCDREQHVPVSIEAVPRAKKGCC
eukprot:Gregarina_sp_Poly_1__4842@NODE_257_length_10511_cov_261_924071_g224_i0_p7_GENE_NODE_257_length_10511_cov_261_924071_g224_i0NODE_257_length_10511_cov_261_924071_g224_i0_p7_ORF_typecomplete_len214_score17_78G_path_suppress/PF15991_5/0_037_NODE_257_length_10511_cov_261_924071_g224_i021342775